MLADGHRNTLIQRKPWTLVCAIDGAIPGHMSDTHPLDPRGLIREAYRMEGLTKADCRSIFLDWALGLDDPATGPDAAKAILTFYADHPSDHPMSEVLREGAERMAPRKRRAGGAMGRRRN